MTHFLITPYTGITIIGKYVCFRFYLKLLQKHIQLYQQAVYLSELTLTYDFCFFICQGFIEKNFLHTKRVS